MTTKSKLEEAVRLVRRLLATQGEIMDALTALTSQVAQNESVEGGAIQALTQLAALYQAAITAGDTAQLQALTTGLSNSATALAAAIAAVPTGVAPVGT